MKKINRNNVKLIIIAISTITLLLFVTIITKNYTEYSNAKEKWNKSNIQLLTLKQEIQTINESIETYETEKETFKEYLFKDQDIPEFLDGISEFAANKQIAITSISTKNFRKVTPPTNMIGAQSELQRRRQKNAKQQQDPQEAPTIAAMPIDMNIEGTFSDLVKFLDYLENFKQLLTISDVTIVTGKEYPALNCKLSIKIYSFKSAGELVKQ